MWSTSTKSPRLNHIALRPQKRGCLLGTGTGGEGAKEWRLDCGYPPKKTGETMDCRQNNGSVTAVSPRHCTATSAVHNCCFNCRAGQSQGQCPLRCCWGTTRSESSPAPSAPDFWANLRIQLHLRPLDLTWNPENLPWWSLCTLYLLACQTRVTAGHSGLCYCCVCVTSLIPLCVDSSPKADFRTRSANFDSCTTQTE